MGIKLRIIMLASCLVTLSTLFSLSISFVYLKQLYERSLQEVFERTETVVEGFFSGKTRELKNAARLVGEVPILSLVVEQSDPKTIEDTARSYLSDLKFDFMDVLSDDGMPIVRVTQEAFKDLEGVEEASPFYEELVQSALDGKHSSAFLPIGDRMTMVAVSPVGATGDYVGVLVMGTVLDNNFASQLKKATGADYIFGRMNDR